MRPGVARLRRVRRRSPAPAPLPRRGLAPPLRGVFPCGCDVLADLSGRVPFLARMARPVWGAGPLGPVLWGQGALDPERPGPPRGVLGPRPQLAGPLEDFAKMSLLAR